MSPVRALLFLLALALAFPVSAQVRAQNNRTLPQTQDGDAAARFRLADQYIRLGQTDRAVALLEDLYAERPASPTVYIKLREAYVAARQFEDALALVNGRIEREGVSIQLLSDRATALHQAGRAAESESVWREALALAPDGEMTYRILSTNIGQLREYALAAAILREGRERLRDPLLYQAELAHLCGLAADYGCAADEYLAFLGQNPTAVSMVQARLARLLESEGAPEALAAATARAVRQDPLSQPYRALDAWLAMERGDYASALDANIAIDRLQGEEGQSLYGFALSAVLGEAFEEAARALAWILDRHPDGAMAPLALFARANLQEKQAEAAGERAFGGDGDRQPAPGYEAALADFTEFAKRFPQRPEAAEALARAAELNRRVFHNFPAAEGLLRDLAARPGDLARSEQARLDLGRVALQQGDLDAARTAFAQVEERLRIGPIAEQARIELARLDFYVGDFESALSRVEAMHENTATDVANDAISLKLLLRENTGPDSLSTPLRAYAEAALFQRQNRPDETLAVLDRLRNSAPSHPIADEADFLRIEALRTLGQTDAVLAALAAFPGRHPGSYLVERTVFLRGEIFERDLADPDGAMAAYADLLERFPGSLLAPDARQRLRRLRGDRPPG